MRNMKTHHRLKYCIYNLAAMVCVWLWLCGCSRSNSIPGAGMDVIIQDEEIASADLFVLDAQISDNSNDPQDDVTDCLFDP